MLIDAYSHFSPPGLLQYFERQADHAHPMLQSIDQLAVSEPTREKILFRNARQLLNRDPGRSESPL